MAVVKIAHEVVCPISFLFTLVALWLALRVSLRCCLVTLPCRLNPDSCHRERRSYAGRGHEEKEEVEKVKQ